MKLLIATLVLGALGAGSLQFSQSQPAEPTAPRTAECEASVRCTGPDTCEVTCTKPDGTTCTIEIACDGDDCRVVSCEGDAGCATNGAAIGAAIGATGGAPAATASASPDCPSACAQACASSCEPTRAGAER